MDNSPLNMPPDQIETFLSGGAEVGSVKHEQAKAALALRMRAEASAGRHWSIVAAVAAAIAAVAAVVSAVAAIT